MAAPLLGSVVFGYDGSELAGFAISHAAAQLTMPRDALVVCAWQPADVGFTPVGGQRFDADRATAVRAAAEQTAAHGAELASHAGFSARALAIEASPIWQGIVTAADQEGASLIVLGAHRPRRATARAHHPGRARTLLVVRTGRTSPGLAIECSIWARERAPHLRRGVAPVRGDVDQCRTV